MNLKTVKQLSALLLLTVASAGGCSVLLHNYIRQWAQTYTENSIENLPEVQAVIVPGAAVYNNEIMSHILYDRMVTALAVYRNGKAEKFLLSGDHGRHSYDEVNTMKNFLLRHGVRSEDIFLDHAGFSTYDTLYRARDIFKVKSAIIVTQWFHLERALFIGRNTGLDLYGFGADRRKYINYRLYRLREIPARVKAVLELMLNINPRFLGPVIDISGDGRRSWD